MQQLKKTLLVSLKKTDFDNKLKIFISNKNEINELSEKVNALVKLILTKELTKD